jgi:hypothetical protein
MDDSPLKSDRLGGPGDQEEPNFEFEAQFAQAGNLGQNITGNPVDFDKQNLIHQERNILYLLDEMSRRACPKKKYSFDLFKIIKKLERTSTNQFFLKNAKTCWEIFRKRLRDYIPN